MMIRLFFLGILMCGSVQGQGAPDLGANPWTYFYYDSTADTVMCLCHFHRIVRDDVWYKVQFFVDEREAKVHVNATGTVPLLMDESDYGVGGFGVKTYCNVTPCFASICETTLGKPFKSNVLTADVEVHTPRVDVWEGTVGGNIKLLLPVPPILFCPPEVRRPVKRCYVKILTHFTDTERTCPDTLQQNMALILYSLSHQVPPFCGIPITMSNWATPVYIPINAAINRILDGSYIGRTLNISVQTICNDTSTNASIVDKSVKIYVSDGISHICKSINDPHITTFDGWHIDIFLEGEFIFYSHRTEPYEVRTFYRRCDEGNATCNCAVAVKSGDDVIVFDKCGPTISVPGTFKPMKITLYLNGQLTKGTRIFSFGGGQKYNVHLPHGSVVTIENGKGNRPNFLNIWIRTTPVDWRNTRGLCGLWNNINYDDGILRDGSWYAFAENNPERSFRSWRINETIEQSLYNGFCPEDFEADPAYTYCVCNVHGADHCAVEARVQDCFPALETKNGTERGKDITAELLENNSEETTKCFLQESASSSTFEYNPSHTAPIGSWPTPSNFTEAEAMQYCTQFVSNSSAGNMCKSYISSTYVNNALQDCVTDIKLTDDKSWAEETLRDILYHCKSDLIYKSTQWETVDGEWRPPMDKFGIICPNDCSGHGTCREGICNCDGGEYVGYDCSIPAMSPPELYHIQGSSTIDLDEGPVKQLSVYGVDFVDSSQLTCHYFPLSAEEVKTPGYYLTKENIYCPWANITGSSFRLSVSNNGVNISRNELNLKVFNFVCHFCYSTSILLTCFNRRDVCVIDDQADCYLNGYINPDNATEVCNPFVSTGNWTVLNRTEIKIRRYGFQSLVGYRMNTLTPNVWFTVYGSTLTWQRPTGGLAIWLDGVNVYIDMINQSSPCLHDLLKCRYGLTVIFNLFLEEYRTKMYIFTNGGDEKGYYGMSMWHERKRLFLSISTKSKIWNVNTKFITLRKYIKIQFSWSPQFGIRLYFDDLLVARSSRFYKRYANNLADKFTVGCSLNQQYFFRGAIDGWNIIEAFIDTIKAYNVSFDVPELTEDPVLEFAFDETSQDTRFLCKIKAGLSDIEYTVRWYQNDKIIKEETLIGRTVASLMEDDIEQLFYEDQIKCSVSPCVPGNCESLRGSWKHSNAFIAKVKVVSESQIIIHERSGYGTINVTSNIPPTLFCSKESRNTSCEVAVTTELAKYWWDFKCPGSLCPVSQVVFGMFNSPNYHRPCSHLITMDTWHSGVIIPVKAAVDTLMDRDQTRYIRLFFTTVNETKLISNVQVTVVDEDKIAMCSSINDPHITTFDSRYYDNYLEGEFILYRHKVLPYEVRSFYRRCNGMAACNCAVVTRSGDDVIIVDVCGPNAGASRHNTPYTLKMYLNGKLTPGTEVIRKAGGKTYEIILPTGTKVLILDGWVIRGSQFINVKIVASTADYNNTEGLCGTFDGDKTNELTTRQGTIYRGTSLKPNEFSLSWRVPVDESLYQGYCGTVDSTFEIKSYCDCMEGQTAMCHEGMDLMYCVEIEKRRGLLDGKRGIKRLTPDLVRDAESPPSRCTTDQPPEEFEYDPEYKSPDPITNITEPDAKKICEDFMKSKEAGKECMEVPGLDVTPIVQGCIADIKITGDTDWAKESLDNLQEECKVVVEGTNTTNITDIIGLICPNSCFDNGNCKEGFCECFYPWIGDDCSVNSTAPPTVIQVGTGEPCDSICFNCSFVKLYGDDFADSENLTCHYKTLDMNLSAISDVMTSKAEYFNRRIVTCYFPSDGIYEVAVSNDGEITSEYKIYIIYNSYCHHCTNTGCTKRTDGCRIDGTCLLDGFVNPQNINQTCEVAVSSTNWSTWKVEDITIQTYLFDNQEIMKNRYNITVGGGGSLEFVETCVAGENAVFLNGSQFLLFRDVTETCLGDIEKCKHGVTFRFYLKFMTQSSKCYVFSNGGDSSSSYGHAMWMENGRLYARTTNRKNEWVIASSFVKMEEFMMVEMSWSLQSGLYLSFNEQVIGSQQNCVHRPVSNYTVFSDFVIGASSKKDHHCRMVIEYLTVLYGYKDLVDSTGIQPGNSCEATSTEAIPSSSAFSTSEALTDSTTLETKTFTTTSLPVTDSTSSHTTSMLKTTTIPDIYGSYTTTPNSQLICGSAAQMSSADVVITTTSTIAGILFIFIFIIFICTCRRKQKKKKRFLKKHGPDSQSIEGKGFFTKTIWIPFWKQRGHTFFQYKTTPEIPISDSRSHRYQTRRETMQYAPSASGDSRMYTNRAYEEDFVTDAHAFRNLETRQSSIIYDNARNSRTFGSEFIGKTNGEMQNNSVYSSVYSSHSEKRQYNSWSHEDHRKNGKMHSNAEERVTEKTVWVPAETEDVAVYQAVEKQRKDKTEVNMSKQKTEGNKYESAQNTNMASNINGNQSTHLSTHMLETNGELCPYCIHAHTEGRKLVHRVSNRKGNSVDNSSQTDFAYEIRSSVSAEETDITLKGVDQYTDASIQKGDNKILTKTTLSQPLLKTTRIQYDGVDVSRKQVKTSESENDERVIIEDKRKVWPSLEVGKIIQSETKQSVFGDGSSGMVSTGSEMHQDDERTSQVILLKRMQSNSNYGTQGFGASIVRTGESDGDHEIKIIHGEDKSSIPDIRVGETTLGNQQGSGATSTGMLEKEQSLFKNTLENNGEKIENKESTSKTFKKSIDGHVSSVQLPKTGQRSLIFIKGSSDSSFMNANNDTKMSRAQDDNKEVSINVSVLRKAESETGAINEEEQLKRRGAEVQEQTLWFHGDSDDDNDQSDSTSSAMLDKTTNLTEYDKTGSSEQKDEKYEIVTSWLPYEQGQDRRKTAHQLSEERKEEVEDSESFGFRQEGIQRSYIVTTEDRKIQSPGHNQYTEIYKREVVPFRYNTKGKAEYMGEEINVTSTQSFQEMNIRTKGNADEKNIVHTSLSTDKSSHSEESGQGHSYSLKMERKIEIGEPNDARPHIYHVESSERL